MSSVHMPIAPPAKKLSNGYKHKTYAPLNENVAVNGQAVNINRQSLHVNGQGDLNLVGESLGNNINYSNEYLCSYASDDVNFDNAINATFHVVPNIPLNLMPPPPHHLGSVNNLLLSNRRESWKSRDIRTNSPHGSESNESCRSYTSRESSTDEKGLKIRGRNSCSTFYSQALLYNKYSNSTPSIFYTAGTPQQHSNNNFTNKPRYNTQNNRQRRDKRRPSSDLNRRIYGLMERFTSRSKLLHVFPNPQKLLTGGIWDQLNEDIWDLYVSKAQKEQTYIRKLELWRMIYIQISKIIGRYGLFMVGSTMSGLGTDSSDIDMCLLVKPCLNDPRSDALGYLTSIQNVLMDCDFVKNPEVIQAKVPILKFKDSEYGFEVDLNCNNAVGIRNTQLLYCYAHLDWRVRPLVIVVKLWAQANNINDAKNMTISSYSLVLMVIHFLQSGVTPPAIPCLHGLYPEKFNLNNDIHDIRVEEELPMFKSDNKQSLGELFLGFLHYYMVFNYEHYAISVREGTVLLKEECRYARSVKNDATQWKLLCIEEPFDLTNTARSVYDVETFEHIKKVFHYSYTTLMESKKLSLILPIAEDNQR